MEKDFLSVAEAAKFFSISTTNLLKASRELNAFPSYQPLGKKIYFKRSEIEAWLTTTKK